MEILAFLSQEQNLLFRKMVLAPQVGIGMATTALHRQVVQRLSSLKVAHVRLAIAAMGTTAWSRETSLCKLAVLKLNKGNRRAHDDLRESRLTVSQQCLLN